MAQNVIKLDDNFRVETSDEHYYILIKTYLGESKVKGKLTGKMVEQEQKWYYPKMTQILAKYLQEVPRNADSVRTLYFKMLEIEAKIQSL